MSFFFVVIGLLLGLIGQSVHNSQGAARDVERKNDINAMYVQLEAHFNEYREYPTEKEVTKDYDQKLPTLDPEALIDPDGQKIQEGDYRYSPAQCSAIGCKHYTLWADLEDGSTYLKASIN